MGIISSLLPLPIQSLSRRSTDFKGLLYSCLFINQDCDLSDGAHVCGGTPLVLDHAVGLQRVHDASSRTVTGTRREEIQVVAEEGGHLCEIQITVNDAQDGRRIET